jgi:hypothetical protein
MPLSKAYLTNDTTPGLGRARLERWAAAIGISRMIVVANGDEEAGRFGKPALATSRT